MKQDHRLITRGIGIGVIITALLFYCVFIFSVPKSTTMTNQEIIEKAKELGMIFISDLENDSVDKDDAQKDMDTNNENGVDVITSPVDSDGPETINEDQ